MYVYSHEIGKMRDAIMQRPRWFFFIWVQDTHSTPHILSFIHLLCCEDTLGTFAFSACCIVRIRFELDTLEKPETSSRTEAPHLFHCIFCILRVSESRPGAQKLYHEAAGKCFSACLLEKILFQRIFCMRGYPRASLENSRPARLQGFLASHSHRDRMR